MVVVAIGLKHSTKGFSKSIKERNVISDEEYKKMKKMNLGL